MRLFVALDIPEDVRATLAALVAKLRSASPNARWARIEGVHVTLKFIGEVSPERADGITASLANVPFPAPIAIHFSGLGFFPNERRPRVLWAGIQPGQALSVLAAAVETTLEPLGIPREKRAFSPHLTLARFDSPGGLQALHAAIKADGPLEFGSAIAKEFHLFLSVLKRGGAEYTRLATFCSEGSKSR